MSCFGRSTLLLWVRQRMTNPLPTAWGWRKQVEKVGQWRGLHLFSPRLIHCKSMTVFFPPVCRPVYQQKSSNKWVSIRLLNCEIQKFWESCHRNVFPGWEFPFLSIANWDYTCFVIISVCLYSGLDNYRKCHCNPTHLHTLDHHWTVCPTGSLSLCQAHFYLGK